MSSTAVDNATLMSLVVALAQLTAGLQAQLAGQTTQSAAADSATTVTPSATPSTSASTSASTSLPAGNSTPVEPDVLAATLVVADSHTNWYVVTTGRAPGIYTDVFDANRNVVGVRGGTMERVSSRAEALEKYRAAWNKGSVAVVA